MSATANTNTDRRRELFCCCRHKLYHHIANIPVPSSQYMTSHAQHPHHLPAASQKSTTSPSNTTAEPNRKHPMSGSLRHELYRRSLQGCIPPNFDFTCSGFPHPNPPWRQPALRLRNTTTFYIQLAVRRCLLYENLLTGLCTVNAVPMGLGTSRSRTERCVSARAAMHIACLGLNNVAIREGSCLRGLPSGSVGEEKTAYIRVDARLHLLLDKLRQDHHPRSRL